MTTRRAVAAYRASTELARRMVKSGRFWGTHTSDWEQGWRVPEGPARVLLQVAAKHPEAVFDVVRAKTP